MKLPPKPLRKSKANPVDACLASAIVMSRYYTLSPQIGSPSFARLSLLSKVFKLSFQTISSYVFVG